MVSAEPTWNPFFSPNPSISSSVSFFYRTLWRKRKWENNKTENPNVYATYCIGEISYDVLHDTENDKKKLTYTPKSKLNPLNQFLYGLEFSVNLLLALLKKHSIYPVIHQQSA